MAASKSSRADLLSENLLTSVNELKTEMVRIRDGLHGLRNEVSQSLGKAELAQVAQDGRNALLAKDIEAVKLATSAVGSEKDTQHRELWEAIKAINAQIEGLLQYKASIKGGMVLLGLLAPIASAVLTALLTHFWR